VPAALKRKYFNFEEAFIVGRIKPGLVNQFMQLGERVLVKEKSISLSLPYLETPTTSPSPNMVSSGSLFSSEM
jgi:hypothetical protein